MRRPWLAPLIPLYAAGSALRWASLNAGLASPHRLGWPVVSVGNLSTGGAGKTPFTIALARLLLSRGHPVDVLSRGYGRRSRAVERVDPNGNALDFGDEPLLIARETGVPVYVGAERRRAGKLAESEAILGNPARIHLLDDGFQHRQLARQIDIVLVNSADLDDSLLPAGNLREGVAALRRAHAFAVAVDDDAAAETLRRRGFRQPVWRYRRQMTAPSLPPSLAGKPVVAFCGIARPEQFFSGLANLGVPIAARRSFPDHHLYRPVDLNGLRQLAASSGAAALITTAKDLCRLGALATVDGIPMLTAGLQAIPEDEEGLASWLEGSLQQKMNSAS